MTENVLLLMDLALASRLPVRHNAVPGWIFARLPNGEPVAFKVTP